MIPNFRQRALRCHELAKSGNDAEADEEFRSLNDDIADFLCTSHSREEHEELMNLIDLVFSWNDDTQVNFQWYWRFHHVLCKN